MHGRWASPCPSTTSYATRERIATCMPDDTRHGSLAQRPRWCSLRPARPVPLPAPPRTHRQHRVGRCCRAASWPFSGTTPAPRCRRSRWRPARDLLRTTPRPSPRAGGAAPAAAAPAPKAVVGEGGALGLGLGVGWGGGRGRPTGDCKVGRMPCCKQPQSAGLPLQVPAAHVLSSDSCFCCPPAGRMCGWAQE